MRQLPIALCLALVPLSLAAAPAQDASCEITLSGARIDGPCRFTPREGGSFDISMVDGRKIGESPSLSLDITSKGKGTLRGGDGKVWGQAARQSDGACWATEGLTVCARATKSPPAAAPAESAPKAEPQQQSVAEPSEAERQESFGARCHMGVCNWFLQGTPLEIGQGSAEVPGRRVIVDERLALSEHPDEYPAFAPAGLSWTQSKLQVFCSTTRPAFLADDGNWVLLPLPEIFGATEGMSLRYLKACHPGTGNDPYEAVKGLGYQSTANQRDSYPSFGALIAP